MDATVFGSFIAQARKEKNMTQADLAKEIGVTDKAVSRWERGKGFPDIHILEPLSEALDLSILELMRSKRIEQENKGENLEKGEVTEIMANAVEMERENKKQEKTALWLIGSVAVLIAAYVKLTSNSSVGGALFVGIAVGLAAAGIYLFVKNRRDQKGQKAYAVFMLLGIGAAAGMLYLAGVSPFFLMWAMYGIFCLALGISRG